MDRAEIISKYLAEKGEEAGVLFELDVNEAVEKINAAGYDFTAEELHGFADLIEMTRKNDELDESYLDVVGQIIILKNVRRRFYEKKNN